MPRVCPECGRRFLADIARCPDDQTPTFLVNPEEDLIGHTLDGRFTIMDRIGTGGMGTVYRAHQLSMDRDVALKLLRRELTGDEQAVVRFFREAKAASRLANPHTITVFDFGRTHDGLLYIAMELLQGRPLSRLLLEEPGPMAPERSVHIVSQICDSLVEAHEVGVLHRDLKPDNIFVLDGAGARDFVKVLDFGIAKLQGPEGPSTTLAGASFGTPTYMSPEQAQGRDTDARSDLYSIGIILFELLSGRPPFEADTPLAMALQKVQKKAPDVGHVAPDVVIPEPLQATLSALLATRIEDRPASAADVQRQLLNALAPTTRTATPEGDLAVTTRAVTSPPQLAPAAAPAARRRPSRRRVAWPWVVAAISGVALALVASLVLRSGEGPTLIEEAPPAIEAVPAPIEAGPATLQESTAPFPPVPPPTATSPAPTPPLRNPPPAVARPPRPSRRPALAPNPRIEDDDEMTRLLKRGRTKSSPEDDLPLKRGDR